MRFNKQDLCQGGDYKLGRVERVAPEPRPLPSVKCQRHFRGTIGESDGR
jgi:hypothetical protein